MSEFISLPTSLFADPAGHEIEVIFPKRGKKGCQLSPVLDENNQKSSEDIENVFFDLEILGQLRITHCEGFG